VQTDIIYERADARTANSYHRALTESMILALRNAKAEREAINAANRRALIRHHMEVLAQEGFSPKQIEIAGSDASVAYRLGMILPAEDRPRASREVSHFLIFGGALCAVLIGLALASIAEDAWTAHNADRIERGE